MLSYFQDLIQHQHHSNQVILTELLKHPSVLPLHDYGLFAHILQAHQIWLDRLQGRKDSVGPWDPMSSNLFAQRNDALLIQSLDYLEKHGLEGSVAYCNSEGKKYRSRVADVFLHLFQHSAHHRAQIISHLRSHGLKVPSTDYIFWKRQALKGKRLD